MQELDRRTRKTRKAISDAFWKLMQEKDFEEITINDITETADIHRATFYLHYQDKFDWLEKSITELLQGLIDRDANNLLVNRATTEKTFIGTFEYFDENFEFYSIMLKNKGTLFFQQRFKELIVEQFMRRNNRQLGESPEFDFAVQFSASATVGCIEWWIRNDRPLTAEEMAARMADIHRTFPKWMKI